jgi:hypothetical protein
MLIREIKTYRWAEPKTNLNAPEKPKKLNDHSMDEFRYFIMSQPDPAEKSKKQLKGWYTIDELEDMGYSRSERKQMMKNMKCY